MQVPVVMPQLGLTMTEGTVSQWLKKPGEEVKKNEFLLVVETDKADLEVEAETEGTLAKIVVEEGTTVPVGTIIAYLENPRANSTSRPEETPSLVTEPPLIAVQAQSVDRPNIQTNSSDGSHGKAMASPRARRVARELGVDIDSIKGSGPRSRVVEQDIRNAAVALSRKPSLDLNRRRIIAEKMTESVQTIPAFSVSSEANAQQLLGLYESLKAMDGTSAAVKITLTDLLLKALALAVQAIPEVNATWNMDIIEMHNGVDLSLAISTDRGVVAPVIRNVDDLNLLDLAVKRNDLVQRARSARLSVPDVEGGVGTLTNLGMHKVDEFRAIITPRQSFILAVGSIRERPWVEKTLVARPTVRLNLSMDHRVADGVTAARLLEKVTENIEKPFNIVAATNRSIPN